MSKGDQTRQRIVSEAAALFNRQGFAGSSMADLMKATGLEKGGIYRHFSSKEEVAAEAFDYAWQIATDLRMHDVDSVPNSIDRLKRFISNFVKRRSPIPGGCPLLNTAIEADDGSPLMRERARSALRQWQSQLSAITTGGIKKGEIRKGMLPKKLADLIVSSLEGALMISRLERNDEALRVVQAHLNQYLESEVRSAKSRRRRR